MGKIVENSRVVDGFQFSGVGLERLEATEYTLVVLSVDTSASVEEFAGEMEKAIAAIVEAAKNSARGENILLRITEFNGNKGVNELQGFAPLQEVAVPELSPQGMTPLYDGIQDAIVATANYAEDLAEADYLVNAILVVITDGWENASRKARRADIKKKLAELRNDEVLESARVILIGVNADEAEDELKELARVLGLDQFVALPDASEEILGKLAGFVSASVVAQSQALGSGGPSQPVELEL